jgi:hypothetical protein
MNKFQWNHQVIINLKSDIWLKNSGGKKVRILKGIYLNQIFDEPCDGYMFDLDRSGRDFIEYISDGSNLTLIDNENNRMIGIPEGSKTVKINYKYKKGDIVKITFDKDYIASTKPEFIIKKGVYISKIDLLDIKNTYPIIGTYGFWLGSDNKGGVIYISEESNVSLFNYNENKKSYPILPYFLFLEDILTLKNRFEY